MSLKLGKYRHTKSGKLYQVVGTALQTETEELLVIYRPLYKTDYELFARPEAMFTEIVTIKGAKQLRFEKVDD